ncbi:precorrin-3B synthase [Nocardioides ginsengisegetis]|uniref:Precorrin-3B synthase n=1 Tax=Nocardioides ginsengisegetis TaxID=661491 RepID=A0A7W3IY53_9ACTN|nr:nitrite reductase [Nocardioides ginsengisegetis]MBA8802787.1 precorrin-3B synthase [Nocardioides ginsengisegetis]
MITRTRPDLCPGVTRPWPADDGALVRLRLVGGRVPSSALVALSEVARVHGDGDLHVTGRANLQLRALPWSGGELSPAVVAAIEATGLLPSRSHELVRNVLVSPATGLAGGRADLRPVAAALDALLCSDPALAALPGRFLFVLDDGRGDLVGRSCDLGLVALSATTGQVRIGSHGWGAVLPMADAPLALVTLARQFLGCRGTGPTAPWHVDELPADALPLLPRDPQVPVATGPAAYGVVAGGEHVPAPDGVLSPALVARLAGRAPELVVTPWRGVLVPRLTRAARAARVAR